MPSEVVALFFAVGVAGWTYTKIVRRTGGNTKSDATVTVVVGVLVFFIFWSILNAIESSI